MSRREKILLGVTPEMRAALSHLAGRMGISLESVVNIALENFLHQTATLAPACPSCNHAMVQAPDLSYFRFTCPHCFYALRDGEQQ